MGRNKFSQTEIIQIAKLLRLKNAGNRAQQKQVRHELRVNYEFNISDFNEPGRAFGEDELQAALDRGAIQILDDATIANMKALSTLLITTIGFKLASSAFFKTNLV